MKHTNSVQTNSYKPKSNIKSIRITPAQNLDSMHYSAD